MATRIEFNVEEIVETFDLHKDWSEENPRFSIPSQEDCLRYALQECLEVEDVNMRSRLRGHIRAEERDVPIELELSDVLAMLYRYVIASKKNIANINGFDILTGTDSSLFLSHNYSRTVYVHPYFIDNAIDIITDLVAHAKAQVVVDPTEDCLFNYVFGAIVMVQLLAQSLELDLSKLVNNFHRKIERRLNLEEASKVLEAKIKREV